MKEVLNEEFKNELLRIKNNSDFNMKTVWEDVHHEIIESVCIEPDDAKTINEVKRIIINSNLDVNNEVEYVRK